jgi:hypothetical protein
MTCPACGGNSLRCCEFARDTDSYDLSHFSTDTGPGPKDDQNVKALTGVLAFVPRSKLEMIDESLMLLYRLDTDRRRN